MSYYVYIHIARLTGDVFYVGSSNNLKRPYDFKNRTSTWKEIFTYSCELDKDNIEVVLFSFTSESEAMAKEINLIKQLQPSGNIRSTKKDYDELSYSIPEYRVIRPETLNNNPWFISQEEDRKYKLELSEKAYEILVELLAGGLQMIDNLLECRPNKKYLTELENKNYIHREPKTVYVGEYLVAVYKSTKQIPENTYIFAFIKQKLNINSTEEMLSRMSEMELEYQNYIDNNFKYSIRLDGVVIPTEHKNVYAVTDNTVITRYPKFITINKNIKIGIGAATQ